MHRHSRVCLDTGKRTVLSNRLRPRIGKLGLASCDAYARYVESAGGRAELDVLIDLATTHYTRFFREPGHFEWLSSEFIPAWLDQSHRHSECRVWSAATASGEEAWTLAMVLAEGATRHEGFGWQLQASDISGRMLDIARRAIYPESVLDAVPEHWRRPYFERGIGPRTGYCRVDAALRQRVAFSRSSLFDDPSRLPQGQHVIFCRNVMIYFDVESRAEAVRRLSNCLAAGGHLVVGASESLLGIEQGLQPVLPGIYRLP